MAEPITIPFEEWVRDRPSRPSKRGSDMLYWYGSRYRSKASILKRWKADREAKREKGHPARKSLREQAIEKLGDRCAHCGYNDDIRALQIDHIHGGGYQDRKLRSKNAEQYYRHVMKIGRKKFQVLCANCNTIKRHTNNEFRGRRIV